MTRTTAEALPLTPFGQTLHNLRQKIAHVIVTKVLQEEYDDLVEGYLDEILLAADDIIRLPAYSLVAQTYHDNLSAASAEPAARLGSSAKGPIPTEQAEGPVVVPRDEQGRTAYDIIRESNHASMLIRSGAKDRSREPLLGPPSDMAVSRVILAERPDETPKTADLLAVKINDTLAALAATAAETGAVGIREADEQNPITARDGGEAEKTVWKVPCDHCQRMTVVPAAGGEK